MRMIEKTNQFKRDYKREKKGRHRAKIDEALLSTLKLLIHDQILPAKYFDHNLSGNWADHRDCHIMPDLILIYQKPNHDTLRLVRIGSHSELSL